MPSNEIYDLVIIGGGPGGLTAGIYAMRAALKTALIELGAPGGQMNNSDSVENWPGDEYIGGADLAMKFSQHAGTVCGPTRLSWLPVAVLANSTFRVKKRITVKASLTVRFVTAFSSAIKPWWS
jgi:thioredoxin reductase